MDIHIRNIDSNVIGFLDEIVTAEKYGSRSELVNNILTLYVSSHHNFFSKALPPTVKYLSTEVLKEQSAYTEKALNLVYNVNADLLKKVNAIYALFYKDIENQV